MKITKQKVQAVADLKAGYTLGHADVAMLKSMARQLLASMEQEPALYAAEETLAYAKMGELHLNCLSKPMGDAVIPLYSAPQLPQQAVPDEMTPKQASRSYCGEVRGYRDGWNACRAAMLQCSEPETDNTNQQFESLSRGDK